MSNGNGALRQSILNQSGVREERDSTLPSDHGPVPVIVRELLASEAREWEVMIARQAPDPIGFLVQMSVVDPETHELIFEPADRHAIESLGISGLKDLLQIAQKLNGISDDDIEKAKQSLLKAPQT